MRYVNPKETAGHREVVLEDFVDHRLTWNVVRALKEGGAFSESEELSAQHLAQHIDPNRTNWTVEHTLNGESGLVVSALKRRVEARTDENDYEAAEAEYALKMLELREAPTDEVVNPSALADEVVVQGVLFDRSLELASV
jgi:hypothetical protein